VSDSGRFSGDILATSRRHVRPRATDRPALDRPQLQPAVRAPHRRQPALSEGGLAGTRGGRDTRGHARPLRDAVERPRPRRRARVPEDRGRRGRHLGGQADDKLGRLHPGSLQKAACGFANRDGGYVIVGAGRDAATGAALRALDEPQWFSQRAVGVAMALASVGRKTDDIGSRLFVESFRDAMGQGLTRFFRAADPMRSRSYVAPARETSILIGTLLGTTVLGEGDTHRRNRDPARRHRPRHRLADRRGVAVGPAEDSRPAPLATVNGCAACSCRVCSCAAWR
jgi:hypothetical protein